MNISSRLGLNHQAPRGEMRVVVVVVVVVVAALIEPFYSLLSINEKILNVYFHVLSLFHFR